MTRVYTLFLVVFPLALSGCSAEEVTLRSAGQSCQSSDECATNLCYESLCFEPAADDDGDGLINELEAKLKTKISSADSDGDGISDGVEVDGRYDAPPDADGDDIIDALESALLEGDPDGDCIAPQDDPDDAPNLRCCCEQDCGGVGVQVLDFSCDAKSKVLSCTFDVSDDLDGDGLLATCDDDDDGDGDPDETDCAPTSAALFHGQSERCDGLDNDCDDAIDETWSEALSTPCLTAHVDCGGLANFVCSADEEGVECPIEPAPEGTSCDDGNPQTGDDRCDAAGNCAGVVCEAKVSCVNAEIQDGVCVTSVMDTHCYIGELCVAKGVTHPDYPCKRCDPSVTQDGWTLDSLGTWCDDGDPATFEDSCGADGLCVGKSCNDGGDCTTAGVLDGLCVYTPLSGTCFIEGQCYIEGEPDPQVACQRCDPGSSQSTWTSVALSSPCDDGDQCTVNDACDGAGLCGGIPVDCADDLPCTIDACDVNLGCVHSPSDALCDDGVGCTSDTCVLESGCVHEAQDALCDDGDPCWLSQCDLSTGCQTSFSGAAGCLFPCGITDSIVGVSAAADGGTTGHAVFSGDYAFVLQQSSSEKELSVIDLNDPSAPQALSFFNVDNQSWSTGLNLSNVSLPRRGLITQPEGPLFISSASGFHVTDVSDPSDPQVVASASSITGQLYGMVEHPFEPVVYGAIESGAIVSIDVKTLTNPKSQIDAAFLQVETFDVAIGPNNRIFLAGYDLSLQSFDITSPLQPSFASSIEGIASPTNLAESVIEISGGMAVVASNRDGYRLIDVSSPYQMMVVYEGSTPSQIYDLAFFEGYLLLASQDEGLVIIDIAVPSAPEVVATIPLTGTPRGVRVDLHRVTLATSATLSKVIDLTLPCVDDDPCTLDGCHVTDGCTFSDGLVCDDLNPCTTDSCTQSEGCTFVSVPGCQLGGVGAP